jgi:PTH2 family peptidyl-tRNA hydrolase
MSNKVKMVIVIRKELKCRSGKWVSQGAHAASQWLINKVNNRSYFDKVEQDWLANGTTKICLQVDTEDELMEIYQKALDADLKVHLVIDEGVTEFKNVHTKTCLAIGPNLVEDINPITEGLKLF